MRRFWTSSRHASIPETQIPARQRAPSHKSDLWTQAYEDLTKDDSKLVAALEEFLNKEALKIRTDRSDANKPSGDITLLPQGSPDREERLSKFIQTRLAAMNDKKWRLGLGEHSVEILEQVDRIIKTVMVAKDFVSSLSSMDPVHAGLPWAGICLILPLLVNDSKQRSAAIDGLEYIARLIRRCTEIERLYLGAQVFRLSDELRSTLIKLYRMVLEFEARAACQFSRNTAHQTLRNIVTADGWDGLMASIKRFETDCGILLQIIDVEARTIRVESVENLIKEQDERVAILLEGSRRQDESYQVQVLAELQQSRNDLKERQLTSEESKGHECLRTNDYEFDKEKNPDRIPGTCEWFLRHPKYREWISVTESTWLWVTADPGCGKSVLSRFLVDSLKDPPAKRSTQIQSSSSSSSTVCYFFFKDDNEANRSSTNALASILHQIFSQRRELLAHALPDFMANGSGLARLFESLWKILELIVDDPATGRIFIVLDALDECAETSRVALIRKFTSLFSKHPKKTVLKLLITSRPSTPISDEIWKGNVDSKNIKLAGDDEAEMEAISVEIDLVIRDRLRQLHGLRRHRGIDDDVCNTVLQQLLRVENRTYLWVSLIFPEIEKCAGLSKKKLLRATQKIPTTVSDAYEKFLSRSTDVAKAKRLLQVVLAATRPLTLDEMNIALSISENSRCIEDLDLESPMTFRTILRDLCGLFVIIRDSKIYLIHQTAREFLLSTQETVDEELLMVPTWQHTLNLQACNTTVCRICMNYLSFSEFEANPLVPAGRRWDALQLATQEYLGKYAFLEYAANNWAVHWQVSNVEDCELERKRILSICNPSSRGCQTWFQVHWSSANWGPCHPKGFNELIMIVFLDLYWAPYLCLLDDVGLNGVDNHSRSALWWAMERGNECSAWKVTSTKNNLIDAEAALQMASLLGLVSVVQDLLLKFQIDVHARARDGWTAFRRAANNGHIRVLNILRVYSPSGVAPEIKEIALHQAAASGNLEVISYLLDQEVYLEGRSSDGETSLYRCVANDHIRAAELLLQRGAQVDARAVNRWNAEGYKLGETALYRAVSELNVDMVVLLLKYGAEVDALSRNHETALYRSMISIAMRDNVERIVRVLTQSGADIHAKSGTGDTPLQRAITAGDQSIRSIMDTIAADSGVDTTAITAKPFPQPEDRLEQHLTSIQSGGLLNIGALSDMLAVDDEDDGPDRNFSRQIYERSFWDIGLYLNQARDAM